MKTKMYIANTPLILIDGDGMEYRVERGEMVALTEAELNDVAAHVTLVTDDEEVETVSEVAETPANAETSTTTTNTTSTSEKVK